MPVLRQNGFFRGVDCGIMTEYIKAIANIVSIVFVTYGMLDSPLYFHCADCEVYQTEGGHCDLKCLGHCINWLNSEFKEGEK